MWHELLNLPWDVFAPALLTGLAFALYLPVLGCYLRLRDETLAALAYAQVGAAGALLAEALLWPLGLGALAASLCALLVQQTHHRQTLKQGAAGRLGQGSVFALLLVLAWGVSVLLTSNLPVAERLGHALFDGQLLLGGGEDVIPTMLACGLGLLVLARMNRSLLAQHWLPRREKGVNWVQWAFATLTALSIAWATMRLGVMTVFALLLIGPWAVFQMVTSWRQARAWAALLSGLSYALAAVLALLWDQPFGPMLVLTLLFIALLGRWRVHPQHHPKPE